jgi:HlyD family secretion protein
VTRLPLLLVLCVAAAGCSRDGDPLVRTGEVGRATVAEVVEAPATVGARATAALRAPTDATVEEVLVEDGAQVVRGAVLVRLASPAAQDRLRSARHALAQASSAEITVPRADLAPLQDALDAAAAASFAAGRSAAARVLDPEGRRRAEQQVADAEQQYAVASAAARSTLAQADASADGLEQALAAVTGSQRAQASAAVAAARATVDALVVRAPIDGVVTLGGGGPVPSDDDVAGLVQTLPEGVRGQAEQALGAGATSPRTTTADGLSVGAAVPTGAPLLTVTDLGGLTVTAEVDETDVLLVRPGVAAQVEVDAVPDARYAATVSAVDLAPTTSAGGGVTYRVRMALGAGRGDDGAAAPAPRPGMSAVVDLQVRTARDVVAVPVASVLRDEGRDVVFVVEQGRAVRREVRLGAQGEELVEVTTGLSPGMRVVVRDADRLRDGQAVRTA